MIRITVRHKCSHSGNNHDSSITGTSGNNNRQTIPDNSNQRTTGSATIGNTMNSTTSRVEINYNNNNNNNNNQSKPKPLPRTTAKLTDNHIKLFQQQQALRQQQQQLLNRGSVSSDAWSCGGSTPDLSRIEDDAVLGGDNSDEEGAVMMFEMFTLNDRQQQQQQRDKADPIIKPINNDHSLNNKVNISQTAQNARSPNLHKRSVSLIVNPEYDQQATGCSTGSSANNGHHCRNHHYRNRHVRSGRIVVPLQSIDLYGEQQQPIKGTNVSIKATTTTTTTTTTTDNGNEIVANLHVRQDSFELSLSQTGVFLREISDEFAKNRRWTI